MRDAVPQKTGDEEGFSLKLALLCVLERMLRLVSVFNAVLPEVPKMSQYISGLLPFQLIS